MSQTSPFSPKSAFATPTILKIIAGGVLLSGLITISGVLFSQVSFFRSERIVSADAAITLLVGMSFVYLATLLERGKQRAWLVCLPLYGYLVVRNLQHYVFDNFNLSHPTQIVLQLVVPSLTLCGLLYYRKLFTVRSDALNVVNALGRAILVLLVAFCFGVFGFLLLDKNDFHLEISPVSAIHYTIDQFGLTTDKQVLAHTERGKLFLDSLNLVSLGAIFYVGLSLFGPIRWRLVGLQHDRETMLSLITQHSLTSEDFFKLWPQDKAYFFNTWRTAGLAYRVERGTALVVADPVGSEGDLRELLINFVEFARANDWLPAFIHTEARYLKLYEELGFEQQKIGEEALVDTNHFVEKVIKDKYFRQINNRFTKQGFATELHSPPHSPELLAQLQAVTDSWLQIPGRVERGFMMGYFSHEYLQKCPVMVVVDQEKNIWAFINQLPAYVKGEANYDFLRYKDGSPGNINDFLMMNFIAHLHQQGIAKFNMGLCPLAGLEEPHPHEKNRFDSSLDFLYDNANRFYSFKGLKRFKDKYEPTWESRFVVYSGGVRGFARSFNGLRKAMRVKKLY